MYQLNITMTGKGYGRNEKWSCFGEDQKTFATKDAALAWLKENYGKCKRTLMFRDVKASTNDPGYSKTVQTGWIYHFRNADWSHAPVSKWLQQDWCELREINTIDVAA